MFSWLVEHSPIFFFIQILTVEQKETKYRNEKESQNNFKITF